MGVRGSAPAIPSVTIDPGRNGGRIAEVSVKAISGGRKMGTGPGAGPGPQDIYESARERAEVEAARWPYDWVEGVDYPKKEDRSAVSGRLVLDDPEISLAYAELFPDDVTFTIGKSDWSRDWFFQHVPHNTDPEAEALPFYGVRSIGRATPYTIVFETDGKAEGQAVLRLAICGTGTRSIGVSVNGRKAGEIDGLQGDGVITRHGRQGIWYERDFRFDASLLEAGTNTLTLTVPEGPVNNGIIYDYIRLELDESGK